MKPMGSKIITLGKEIVIEIVVDELTLTIERDSGQRIRLTGPHDFKIKITNYKEIADRGLK
jgi:hypothetical protein